MRVPAFSSFAVSAFALIGLLGFAAPSHAGPVDCPAAFSADGSAKVTWGGTNSAAGTCQYLTPPSSSTVANEANVNAAGFFGITDWMATSVSQVNINASTGVWTIPDYDPLDFDYMITFKSGNGTNLISFLFNEEASTGAWSTPFTEPTFDLPGNSAWKDVSHLSIFKHDDPSGTEVPEPATLALFGVGLLGLVAAVRRRKKSV